MNITNFFKYIEGRDVSKAKSYELVSPSRNCLIHKGKVLVRGGLVNDGNAATEDSPIHSEYTWGDSKGGKHALRAYGTKLQLKKNGVWFTLYSGLDANVKRVRFDSWTDANAAIIKKRLFFVDGGLLIHEWSGAMAMVDSVAGQNITIAGSKTLEQLGFDSGVSAAQTVLIVRFANGAVAGIEEYAHSDDCTDNVLHLNSTPSTAPQSGDLVIAKPITNNVIDDFNKDDIFVYKNHVVLTNLESNLIYGSHAETKLDFTVPASTSRTAISPFFLQTDGNNQAMISRGKTDSEILWMSTEDKWFKITALNEQNAYGQWMEIEKYELPPRSGALPYAVANFKGDLIYLSQDRKLQRIQTLEVLGTDELTLLSDDVEDLLLRLDMEGVRLYYESRYIWIFCPQESTVLMLDMIGDPDNQIAAYWQPPQIVPASCMSIIDGVRYGHSSVRNETFEMFSGKKDLGVEIEAVIACGYLNGGDDNAHAYKQHTKFAWNGRMSKTTKCQMEQFFETDGAKAKDNPIADGAKIKLYDVPDDVSWGMVPWASRANAAADMEANTLKRFYVYSAYDAVPYFEHRPVFTITGTDVEFQLLGWYIDQKLSNQPIGSDLWIPR